MVGQNRPGSAKNTSQDTGEPYVSLSKGEQEIACLGGLNSSMRKENGVFTEKVRTW